MKYIKVYKLFESNIDDINDCFLNIQDDGYFFDVREMNANPIDFTNIDKVHLNDLDDYELDVDTKMIEIRISKGEWNSSEFFQLSDIIDSVEMSIGFSSDMGYRVDSFLAILDKYDNSKDYYYKDISNLPERIYKLYITFVKN